MNNKEICLVTISSGIIIGAAAIYAIKNKVKLTDVISSLEKFKDKFIKIIKNLLSMGKEALISLYNKICAKFKLQMNNHYIK